MYNCIFYFSIYLQNKTIKNNIIYFHKICFIILIYIYLCFCEFVSWFLKNIFIYIFQNNFFSKTFMFIIKKNVLGNIFITKEIIQISFFLTTKTIWNPKITKNEKWWKVMKSDEKSSLFITFHFLCFFKLKKCLNKIIHPREVHS